MIDYWNMTTDDLVQEYNERGNTDPRREHILAELYVRVNSLYREQAEWYDELERTQDYLTSQDIERNLERIENELLSMAHVLREADKQK